MKVVAVSGWGHSADVMRSALTLLPKQWEIELRRLDDFLSHESTPPEASVLIGWSAGSLAILKAITSSDAQVEAVVLLSATARFSLCDGYACGVPPMHLRAMMIGIRNRPKRVLRQFFTDSASPQDIDQSTANEKTRFAYEQIGPDTLYDGLIRLRDTDVRNVLHKIKVPTLLLHGQQDQIISVACAEFVADRMPDARLKVLDGVGHAIPEQASVRAGREIAQFLRETHLMEPPNPNTITARFAAAAPSYDREADVQRRLAREVVRMLDNGKDPSPILEVGCGTGLMTELLTDRFRQSELHAIDICGVMIERAKARLINCQNIRWHVGDARSWGVPHSFELVTGSSVLHWLAPIDQSLQHLATLARPGGQVALGVMVRGTLAELHEVRQFVAPRKTGPDPLPSVDSVLAGLAAASLQLEESRGVTLRNSHAGARDFLRAIHAQGVTAGIYDADSLLNRSELTRLAQVYDQRFCTSNGEVHATYQVLLVRARNTTNEGSG